MKRFGSVVLIVFVAHASQAKAQTWTRVAESPPFLPVTTLLLTDGTVLVHARDPVTTLASTQWWRLRPDPSGSYEHGSWSPAASLPAGYAPLYYASAVLPDGRVLIQGGEYNGADLALTNQGALYDPVADTWTPIAAPSSWPNIGDAPGAVLESGTFMIGRPYTGQQAVFDPRSLAWTVEPPNGKAEDNTEEGWTLLPSGDVLTVDVNAAVGGSELYDPRARTWSSGGRTAVSLSSIGEIGPAILRPDGTVFAVGDNGHTAIYEPARSDDDADRPSGWRAGPSFPSLPGLGQIDVADGPASLLPDGHVLCAAGPGFFTPPTVFFEFDGTALAQVPSPPGAAADYNSFTRLLVLPTGQILFTDGTDDVELYTSMGRPERRWAPEIVHVPERVRRGRTYRIEGRRFNGLSQANAYGDDVQNATNYPLVRIVHEPSGHLRYARTHDPSTMGVATGRRLVSTFFDVPPDIECGKSRIEVVANGIASEPVVVWVQ